jgi:hypothetical protein
LGNKIALIYEIVELVLGYYFDKRDMDLTLKKGCKSCDRYFMVSGYSQLLETLIKISSNCKITHTMVLVLWGTIWCMSEGQTYCNLNMMMKDNVTKE